MLIGLTGKAGAGKDTVADHIVSKYGFQRYSFATALKEAVMTLDPYVGFDHIYGGLLRYSSAVERWGGLDSAKRDVPEVRRLLQVFGTEVGRNLFGDNVWVDIVDRKWKKDDKPNAVITDVRFMNEFDWVLMSGGVLVQIVRPNNPCAIVTTHASESFTAPTNLILTNDSTIGNLQLDIDVLMEQWL